LAFRQATISDWLLWEIAKFLADSQRDLRGRLFRNLAQPSQPRGQNFFVAPVGLIALCWE